MLINSVDELVGKTPLLKIEPSIHGLTNIDLYAKLELLNQLGGSIKDRTGLAMIIDHIAHIKTLGQTVIESSSGNTAIALALICNMWKVPLVIVTNRIRVREIGQLLRFLGAEVMETPGMSSCPDPTDPDNPLSVIRKLMAANPGRYFFPDQYTSQQNSMAHFSTTGPEIVADLGTTQVDYFITGLGTAGSSRGVGEYLQSINVNLTMIGVVARRGHLIPGIRNSDEMFEVGLFNRSLYKNILEVDTDGAIDGSITLCRELGVLAGPSSGAVYTAALRYLAGVDPTCTERRSAVIIFFDRLERYLSYFQKHRPEVFGLGSNKPSPFQVCEIECVAAPLMTVEEAKSWLTDKLPSSAPKRLVVDLRGLGAFVRGHIPGSINRPSEQLDEDSQSGEPFSPSNHYLFVCPFGEQSRQFAAFFNRRGIHCFSLVGGYIAWRDAQAPIEKSPIRK